MINLKGYVINLIMQSLIFVLFVIIGYVFSIGYLQYESVIAYITLFCVCGIIVIIINLTLRDIEIFDEILYGVFMFFIIVIMYVFNTLFVWW